MFKLSRVAALVMVAGMVGMVGTAAGQVLPEDPSLVKGELDNGMHYIIRKHNNPAGKAVMWIHMSTGSLNETERQRGIAHYTEHMAFNGSEHFPPGQLIPFFQSMGMTFGRDQNAFTNMSQTTYQLTLPKADSETLGKGMTFFSDVIWKLTLSPTEIDAERQIILEERRRSLSGRQRLQDVIAKRTTPGSIYGERLTIGTDEAIKAVNEKDFRDYYGKWYTASNATLLVIADADPADVAKVVKEKFADVPKKPKPVDQPVGIKAYDKSFAVVATDPEVRGEQVEITWIEPPRPPMTTIQQYRNEIVLRLAEGAMNRRLGDKDSRSGGSFNGARVSSRNQAGIMHETGISGRPVNGKWKAALQEISLELQRGRAFGFNTKEIEDGKKDMMTGAELAVEREGSLAAGALIAMLNGSVASGDTVTSATQRLDLLKKILPTITIEEINKRFADEFEPRNVAFVATLPSGSDVPTEAELLDIGTKALAVKPTQESEAVHNTPTALMTELPKGGAVAEAVQHEPTQVWESWLSNNARVHYKFMDKDKNQVSIRVSLIGGELLETAENRGITSAAQLAWGRAATQHLSSTDIREFMTGKKISVRGGGGFGGGRGGGGGPRGGGGGGGGADSIGLSINGNSEELETGFQLAYLMLTEPKIEESSFTQWQQQRRESLGEEARDTNQAGMRAVAALTYPDSEPRTKPPTPEQIAKLTLAGSQAWLEKLLKESPIEITIVGDVPREKAMELTTKYLGSLPTRERVNPKLFADLRKLKRPVGPRTVEKIVDTNTDKAFVYSGFYGVDESDRAGVRAMSMAARILTTRMTKEVREEAQLVYSISASSRAGTTFPGFGVFAATAPTDPLKATSLVNKLATMYETFAKTGPTEEELGVAKKQLANTRDEEVKQPAFWQGRLNQLTFRGASLDEIVAEPAAIQALTAKDVQGTFAKCYSKENSIVVVAKPKEGGKGSDKPADTGAAAPQDR